MEHAGLVTELMIAEDGRIFARNLTRAMARVLSELNSRDEEMKLRATENGHSHTKS